MINVDIIAAGRMKNAGQLSLFNDYKKRLSWHLSLYEFAEQNADEKSFGKYIKKDGYVVALDARGHSLSSLDFARKIETLQLNAQTNLQFLIGASDGLPDSIRKRADFLLSFGLQTWPHMLARIMLIEQLYRAQQILAGHPYHK